MQVFLIHPAKKGGLVHGTDTGKKTGCGINLTKPENVGKYISGNAMTDLKEITCDKCKVVLAKRIIKEGNKEMQRMMKEALSFSVLLSLMLFFFWPRISTDVIGAPDLGVYLCLCLFGFSSIIYRFLSLGYRMEQNAKLYTIQGVLYVLVTKLGYLSVGFGSARAKPAILMLTLTVSVFTLVFLLIQRKRFDFHLEGQVSRPFVREIGAYAAPLIPITLISWLESSVGSMVLRQLMGFAALGI